MKTASLLLVSLLLVTACGDNRPTETELFAAVRSGRHDEALSAVRAWLDAGGDPNVKDASGIPLICEVTLADSYSAIKLLLDAGVEFDILCQKDSTPISRVTASLISDDSTKSSVEMLTFLHNRGVEICDPHSGSSPLFTTVSYGRVENAGTLLELGCDPNVQDKLGRTPLHKCFLGTPRGVDIARLLIAYGADTEAEDEDGLTPLDYAMPPARHAEFATFEEVLDALE